MINAYLLIDRIAMKIHVARNVVIKPGRISEKIKNKMLPKNIMQQQIIRHKKLDFSDSNLLLC